MKITFLVVGNAKTTVGGMAPLAIVDMKACPPHPKYCISDEHPIVHGTIHIEGGQVSIADQLQYGKKYEITITEIKD